MKISPAVTKFALDAAKAAGGAVAIQFTTTLGTVLANKVIEAFRPKPRKDEVVEEEEIEVTEEPETDNE